MPWKLADAQRHTHLATTSRLRRIWTQVANKTLADTGDDAIAIRVANATVRRQVENTKSPTE